jgi:hypothetical protein
MAPPPIAIWTGTTKYVTIREDGSIEFALYGYGCVICSDSYMGVRYVPKVRKVAAPGGWEQTAVASLDEETITKTYQFRYIAPLFKAAKIPNRGHMVSHRLRDTFAVDLLQKGDATGRGFQAAWPRKHQDHGAPLC